MNVPRIVKIPLILLGGLGVGALLVWIGVGLATVAGVARPEYVVVSEHDGYEIRDYAPQIVAEVKVDGDFEEALNRGFRTLADYIFGNNTVQVAGAAATSQPIAMTASVLEQTSESSPIAMTAPVLETEQGAGGRTVTFVMPQEYTMETIPKPNNPEVKLVEIPRTRYAALRFSGWVDAEKATAMKSRLLDRLARDKQETAAPIARLEFEQDCREDFLCEYYCGCLWLRFPK